MNKEYTEEDLRQAFYKGREQVSFVWYGTPQFLRATFNGYLRELDGQESPYEIWGKKVHSLILDEEKYEAEIKLATESVQDKAELQRKIYQNLMQIKD